MKVVTNAECGFSKTTVITLNTVLFCLFPNVDFFQDPRSSSHRSGICPHETGERSVEGIGVKWHPRWTRKSKYRHTVACGEMCVCHIEMREIPSCLVPEAEINC